MKNPRPAKPTHRTKRNLASEARKLRELRESFKGLEDYARLKGCLRNLKRAIRQIDELLASHPSA